jgi:error-prone DNA polymerase
MPYVPLLVRSHYSFLEGASHPEELIEEAHRLGLHSLALVDRDGVYGVVRAHTRAVELGVKLIIGSTITVEDGTEIVLIAPNQRGYARLCGLISVGRRRCPKGQSRVTWAEVCEVGDDLIAMWGGEHSLLAAAPPSGPVDSAAPATLSAAPATLSAAPATLSAAPATLSAAPATLSAAPATLSAAPATLPAAPTQEAQRIIIDDVCRAYGDRLYVLLTRHQRAEDIELGHRLIAHAETRGLPLVAANEVLYASVARRDLQDVLTCVRHHIPLRDAGTRLKANAEHGLKTTTQFDHLFADLPSAIQGTESIAARCRFSLTEIRYRYPAEHMPNGLSKHKWLEQLTFEGAFERYGGPPSAEVEAQLTKELSLIEELDYGGYFLTMHELVQFCRKNGILCQGRGSAANSSVCYCLGITAVDPVQLGLLFERFLSRERAEPPDIDLDIAHERREEVIQHVYEHYGREHAAMVANVIRYRAKSAVREVGKTLGIPETALDRVAKLLSHSSAPTVETYAEAGLDPSSPSHAHLIRLTTELLDTPRHLSIHPGGFLLGDRPVHELVPIENASMEGRTVIQWDKYDVEALGLFKVDLLGLGALSMLDRCFHLIQKLHDLSMDMASLPPDDPKTFDMICSADTVGTFQIESRAQMNMLPRLRPRTFYDLVIEVSIVRPGPIAGDMVHPYLRRRQGKEPIEYPHDCLRPVLEKTLGVPLFQEQVMKLAVVAADYTPGEADQLRRDMAAWRVKGKMEQHHERLVRRMVAKGIEREFAERVFEQIRGFGEYGFPESHAASFALISYATCYLRCHFLPPFVCALLNSQPMGFYSPATILDDARRRGLQIRPIDVTVSDWDCTCEVMEEQEDLSPSQVPWSKHEHALRLGIRYVKGLSRVAGDAVLRARTASPFQSVEDAVHRIQTDQRSLRLLAEAGAFRTLSAARRDTVWEVLGVATEREQSLALESAESAPEFDGLGAFEEIAWDYQSTQTSAAGHPLGPLRAQLLAQGLPDAATIARVGDGRKARFAGLVICRQRPGTASGVVFMTLEDETGFVNVVLWPKVFEEHHVIAKTSSFLGVTGRVQSKDNVVHLVADSLWVPELDGRPQQVRTRNFH